MRKWLCILIVFMLFAAVLPSSALAEGDDEANGVYDPFDPENLDQGAPPDERHTYDDSSDTLLHAYYLSTPSDPRYVNVLLSQKVHTTATVWFTGNYALCDSSDTPIFRMENEYSYTIAVNGTNLELRAADGTVLYTGTGFYFKEYAPPDGLDYNYFKVAQVSNGTSPSDRIYKGELNCYYKAQSGSYVDLWAGIYLVNRVYIEDYLKGVITAEMGTGFPAEALKAQTIVARNYAVRSKRTDGRIFDVYDYNLSQCYYGLYRFSDTDAAVDATAGKVLTYDGSVIKTFYCNTNGGYTETSDNVWPGEGLHAWESVRYDEYDLRTTKYVENVTIPAVNSGSNTYVASLIKNALVPALQEKYPDSYSNITADQVTITSLAITDCFDTSNQYYDSEDPDQNGKHFSSVDITFSGISVNGEALASPETVSLSQNDFYIVPDNGRPLDFFEKGYLEFYWLVETDDGNGTAVSYTIRHARNGSGVGLSQQGAVQRANAGYTAAQILDFYFPLCTVEADSALGEADALDDISNVSFQKTYDVIGHEAYVYADADQNSLIRGILEADSCVQITSSDETWAKIVCQAGVGYIRISALERTFVKAAVTNIYESLTIRSLPDPSSSAVGTAHPDDVFTLLTANEAEAYHRISFSGGTGYISSRYSKLLTAAEAGDEAGIPTYTVSVAIPTGYTDTTLWVDGVPYQGTASGGMLTATVYSTSAVDAVMYEYDASGTPTGMSVWLLSYADQAYAATKADGFTDLLSYHGFSARVCESSGIRFVSGISVDTRDTLQSSGIEGYRLLEYGTVEYTAPESYGSYPFVICQSGEFPTDYDKAYWTENGVTYDRIVETADGRIRFSSASIDIADENLNTAFIFRAYIELTNGTDTIILYGAPMSRSIYTIAKYYMDEGIYTASSEEGIFLNRIIGVIESGN